MWGIIPAAGIGARIQPLAFSKELLPVGSQASEGEKPRAVSEYILERMVIAGATQICFVISPRKTDIIQYYSHCLHDISIYYAVQPEPAGLCDAVFRAAALIAPDELAVIGLPDTIWFPEDGLQSLGQHPCSFLLFPSEQPELFDSVLTDSSGDVAAICTKCPHPPSNWIWGAFQMSGSVLRALAELWQARGRNDQYFGPLMNEYLKRGGHAHASHAGTSYMDVGTLRGYREAMRIEMKDAIAP